MMRDRVTRGALLASWITILVLRLVYIGAYRIDTDEPQHLHVIWSWVQGLVQYRDVFDNHAPLFHLLLAPLTAAVGERPNILLYMRVAMLPLSALALWSTYAIGRATFGRSVGAWAAVFAALVPGFFLASVEFRADALWTAFWLLALAVLLRPPLLPRRSFLAGFLLGAALCTSLKTVLLLAALGSALAASVIDARATPSNARATLRRAGLMHYAVAGVLGFALLPLATIVFFAWCGALPSMVHATITHNVLGGMALQHLMPLRLAALVVAVPLWWSAGALARRSTADPTLGVRRQVLVLVAFGYVALLGCWPIATRQDFEPWSPLIAILATAAGFTLVARVRARLWLPAPSAALTAALGGTVVLAQVILLLTQASPWNLGARVDPGLLSDVLRLTRPSDTIMDLKGETVFRERPFYYALETLTRERLRNGSIADTIPEELVARRTCVAVSDTERFPPRAREFLQLNYVTVGRLRVAGSVLAPASPSRQSITFDVRVPTRYAIVAGTRSVRGWLDGRPYTGPVFLAAGRHRLRVAPAAAPIVLVWAQAIERGFVPVLARGST